MVQHNRSRFVIAAFAVICLFLSVSLLLPPAGAFAGGNVTGLDGTGLPPAQPPPPPAGSMSGRVTELNGVTGISGVTVSVRTTTSGTTVASAATGTDGAYAVTGLAAGQYYAWTSKTNYERKYYSNVYTSGEATAIPVTSGTDTPNINFSLGPGGSISGTVRNADGTAALADMHLGAKRSNWSNERGARSTGNGTYTISGLPYGDYTIYAGRGEMEGGDPSYVREYYNEKAINQLPDTVTVSSGNNPSGVNFTLATGGAISGRITRAEDGAGINAAKVSAYFQGTWEWVNDATADASGNYTLTGMPAGQFVVTAWADGRERRYYPNGYGRDNGGAVSVFPPAAAANINISLGPGGTVSGTVRNADGSAGLAGMNINASFADGKSGGFGATSRSDGSYTISGLPYDTYKIYAGRGELNGGDPSYAREYYNNRAINQSPDPVAVAAGVNPTGIDFTLAVGGAISGRITREDGTTPISGATVRAYFYSAGEWVNDATTASDGTYTIPGIPTGQFAVYARAGGRELKYFGNAYTRTASTPVYVATPNNTPSINISLGPGGSISGTVRNADGSATLPNMRVEAQPTDGSSWNMSATSRSDGAYTISYLPYNTYKLWAGRGELNGGDPSYAREVYSNRAINQSPDPVAVAAGVNATGIDFTLAIGGAISGRITREDATGIPGARVYAYFDDTWEWVNDATTASDGTYTIPGVPPGQFVVSAWADGRERKYYGNVYARENAAPVVVGAPGTASGFNISLGPGGTVSGTVRNADGSAALPNQRVYAQSTDSTWNSAATSRGDGTYTITGLPYRSYKVYAGRGELAGGDPRYAREYYNNKAMNQTPDPVNVAAGVNPTGIDFTLGIGGSISGRITRSEDGTGISGATAYAYHNTGELANQANADSNGYYTIPGIPSGQFYVAAWASGREWKYYNNVYLRVDGALVTVNSPGNTAGIDFSLGPGGSISGVVTGSGPLANISINARQNEWPSARGGTSNEIGAYTINGLPYGSYKVYNAGSQSDPAFRYLTEYFQEQASWGTANPVVLSAGSPSVSSVNFSLVRPSGSISGNITYAGSLTGPRNLYVASVGENIGTLHGPSIAFTGPGTYPYSIPYLQDGLYVVRAWIDADNSGGNTPTQVDPAVFRGDPIFISGGSSVNGINLSLTDPAGAISGSVSYAGAVAGSHKITVRLHPLGPWGNPTRGLYPVTLNTPGPFTFTPVSNGRYWVSAYLDANDNGAFDPTDPLGVLGGDVPQFVEINGNNIVGGLPVVIRDPGTVSGTISYGSAIPDPGNYRVIFFAVQFWGPFREYAFSGYRQGPGSYSLPVPAGRYVVFAFLDAGWDTGLTTGDPWGVYGDMSLVTVSPGGTSSIDVAMSDAVRGIVWGAAFLEAGKHPAGTAVNISGPVSRTITTGDGGEFIAVLPAGTGYNIVVSRSGFLPWEITNVQVLDIGTAPTMLAPATLLAGNADNNNRIDVLDLAAVAAAFNTRPPSNPNADFNGDGIVDIYDLFWVGKNFGQVPAAPRPAQPGARLGPGEREPAGPLSSPSMGED
ncbi:MAG: carboxypeptidase regulatory-like domain-containing protein [Chloroflexi bacterium]|nr:carboxypeptidase regulatory-like domain-containing protein [Chloroflexota bacterium]